MSVRLPLGHKTKTNQYIHKRCISDIVHFATRNRCPKVVGLEDYYDVNDSYLRTNQKTLQSLEHDVHVQYELKQVFYSMGFILLFAPFDASRIT